MTELVCNEKIRIVCTEIPEAYVRVISIEDKNSVRTEKEKFPFKLKNSSTFNIYYDRNKTYQLDFESNFVWDGASIPKGLWGLVGSYGDPEFLIASMVHDKLCNNHYLVDNNRYLSSLIFKELLISCGVSAFKANLMFFAVDNFQKFCGWNKPQKIEIKN